MKKYNFNITQKSSIIYLLIVSFTSALIGQTTIPIPTNKSETKTEHSKYYSEWVSQIQGFETEIRNSEDLSHSDLSRLLYNRFVSYYKMLTDRPNDILLIFYDGFDNDKHSFCHSYKKGIMRKGALLEPKEYYGKIQYYMDRNCNCVFESYNKDLISTLVTMKERDQRHRGNEYKFEIQKELDSINTKEILEIIETQGYPDRRYVGIEYEAYAIYILQHSNLETMEDVLPIIKEKTVNNLLSPRHMPFMIDRIEMLKGKPQLYGTQSKYNKRENNFELYECKYDLETTNDMRKKCGLRELEGIGKQ